MATDYPQQKTAQTCIIEEMLKVGQPLSVIASSVGVSKQRVKQIKFEMENGIVVANSVKRKIEREELRKKYEAHVNTIKARRSPR